LITIYGETLRREYNLLVAESFTRSGQF